MDSYSTVKSLVMVIHIPLDYVWKINNSSESETVSFRRSTRVLVHGVPVDVRLWLTGIYVRRTGYLASYPYP